MVQQPEEPREPSTPPPAAPKKRGKSPEQYEAELDAYYLAMRQHFAEWAKFNREKAIRAGVIRYEWLAMDVHGTCKVARRNKGKTFAYNQPPKDGHPCEGECTSPDWCRCSAIPIIKV